jgi:carboxyl-terminal processing protease
MTEEGMFRNKKIGLIVVIWFVCGVFIGGFYVHRVAARSDKTYEKLKLFTEVVEIVKENYVEEKETDELITEAIKGMLTGLDPHSAYLSPDMYQELQVETRGSFGGLGIEIAIKDGILTVIAPIEDTPAYAAGVEAGDKIVKIDGESTKGLSLLECVKLLRGPKGTTVTITIARQGMTELKDITIERDIIEIKSVKYRTLDKGYALLRLLQYQEHTTTELRQAVSALEAENPQGLKGVILDMRNNPGGLLDQAVKVADFFLDDGVIVSIKGRGDEENMVFNAHREGTLPPWPMVVLVNHGSASASEIVAGAVQDYGRAVIMGTTTFGKGSVQTIIPLEDGSGIRLTTARYYTPNGRSIQDKGIDPDIPLPLPEKGDAEKTRAEIEDTQLNRALEHLKSLCIYQEYLRTTSD